jgi:hypothetical protein
MGSDSPCVADFSSCESTRCSAVPPPTLNEIRLSIVATRA